jgi:chemotaxis response regulator CheB
VTPARVVVVDDSPVARDALTAILEQDGDVSVIATAGDAAGAAAQVAAHRPDVVTMDILMPGGGLAAIEEIMAHAPTPIVVVTAIAARATDLAFEAVSRGALEVALKPATSGDGAALRAIVRRVARIPVVRHVKALRASRVTARPAAATTPAGATRVAGVAASAGGPAAIAAVLEALPADLPGCVAVVQHMPPSFVGAFADFLRRRTALEVSLVPPRASVDARPGVALLPAAEHHLVATGPRTFTAVADPPLAGQRPSATLLFRSLARWHGARAIGVVLTGIGDDGAAGLKDMLDRGALTIAQDERTSAVFGMPRAAAALGAAAQVLPLGDIAPAVAAALAGDA